ncbi:MAG: holin [Casimicrobiaceae bacterium]
MSQKGIEDIVISHGTKVSVGTATATSAYGFLSLNEWVALGGLVIAILSLLVTAYYTHKKAKRDEAEHELRMKLLRAKTENELGPTDPDTDQLTR